LQEAARRKLPGAVNTPQALRSYQKHNQLFQKYNILSQQEIDSKINIKLETYYSLKNIEYKTAVNMVETRFLPAVLTNLNKLLHAARELNELGAKLPELDKKIHVMKESYTKISELNSKLRQQNHYEIPEVLNEAEKMVSKADKIMNELRVQVDSVEQLIEYSIWPLPAYREIVSDI
jgi:glutamine synthetase